MIEVIPFHKPLITGRESHYLQQAVNKGYLAGDGIFNKKCTQLLKEITRSKKIFLTPSCTHALEMAAMLSGLQNGDEVIMSSFTHPSTANAFARLGCRIAFVDVDSLTMNIDASRIEEAINERTKAVVAMHYGGVGCQMNIIKTITEKYDLLLIEDAAHCIGATYNNKPLGTFGQFGALSFHQSKNIHCGEGGVLFINDEKYFEQAAILRDRGTNRADFLKNKTPYYNWVNIGSNYMMNELSAAFLLAQLEELERINIERRKLWELYKQLLYPLSRIGKIKLFEDSGDSGHNAHVYYIKCENFIIRKNLINYLNKNQIIATFHYQPLHVSPGGRKWGYFVGDETCVSVESERLLRLPLYSGLKERQVEKIVCHIFDFFETNKI